MKLIRSIVLALAFITSIASAAQPSAQLPTVRISDVIDSGQAMKHKKLNIFVISSSHKNKLDLATRYNILRTKVKAFFRPNHFVSIVANSEVKACDAIVRKLDKRQAKIGTIWFDSHGQYIKGYSLFTMGKDEIDYRSLKEEAINAPMKKVATYTDRDTRVVIGSCYGGATYRRSSIDYKDTTRMNGIR